MTDTTSQQGVALAPLTSMRVGGAAERLIEPATERELLEATQQVWAAGDDWCVLGGGSNVLVSDEGFDGTVIRVVTRGIVRVGAPSGTVRLRVQAGESWDGLVQYAVANGWAGFEGLSGIPGSVGAAPIQNIGAYGQEAADSLYSVDFLDYDSGRVQRLAAAELGLGYRTSIFKQGRTGLVLSVTFDLVDVPVPADHSASASASASASDDAFRADPSLTLGQPINFPQLAASLGVPLGARVPLAEVRRTVLALRAGKGMVLSDADPDSVSCGSFFTNPIVTENFARALPADVPRWLIEPEEEAIVVPLPDRGIGELDVQAAGISGRLPSAAPLPADAADLSFAADLSDRAPVAAHTEDWASPAPQASAADVSLASGPLVKLSAAWLIEAAGIDKGYRLPGSRAAISTKHTLAIVNTGGATAADVAELARYIQQRVSAQFGITLTPEPVYIGFE